MSALGLPAALRLQGQLLSAPPRRGTVPARCLGAGRVARCLVLLPDVHHRSRGRGLTGCAARGGGIR